MQVVIADSSVKHECAASVGWGEGPSAVLKHRSCKQALCVINEGVLSDIGVP